MHATYHRHQKYEELATRWDVSQLSSGEYMDQPLSSQQSENWENSTYNDTFAYARDTKYELVKATRNRVAFGTSAFQAGHVKTCEEYGEEDVKQLAAQISEASIHSTHIHNRFDKHRILDAGIASVGAVPCTTQLESSKLEVKMEYQYFLNEFTTQHLSQFYEPGNQSVQKVAVKAAKMVTESMKISLEFIPGLAKLALYDFVFLCDNSCSMKNEKRTPALKETLKRVAEFATILSSSGISIRMLNSSRDGDGTWDHLSTVKDVTHKMKKFSYAPGTPLGTRLWDKILEPLIIRKASSGKLRKPVVVIIITDGEANGEIPTQLRDNIYYCDKTMRELGYGDAAVVFLISRVGSSEDARVFVEGLGKDVLIGSTVYVSPHDLRSKWAAFMKNGDNTAYTELLIKLFLAALGVRTKD